MNTQRSLSLPRVVLRRVTEIATLRSVLVALVLVLLVGTSFVASPAGASSPAPATSTSTTATSTTSTTAPAEKMTGSMQALITPADLSGNGSSFAAPAINAWDDSVSQSPYNLGVIYTPSSSGQGRYEFTNETVDFAVSDTGYVSSSVGTTPPSFSYEFIPITAAGVAFMYNLPGLTKTLQLTSYTACGLLTGQIKNWDDPALKLNGANAGVTLPNQAVLPITESDPAGTNFVLEEYCIDEQPALWAQYAKNMSTVPPPSGVAISATTPGSNWEAPGNGYDESATPAVASNVVSNPGAIGAVQVNYANDSGFTGSNPAHGVAEMQNASGKFTLPIPVDVASALAYATQLSNGTHVLDFQGLGPNVYNPSTYSYLLTPTHGAAGFSSAKGDTMSQYVDYVLTLGQQEAPKYGYASLGLSLERYGIDQITADVPGEVSPTAAENTAYACGDLTPTEVQAGQTTPTCGVTNGNAPPPPPGATKVTTVNGGGTGATATVSTSSSTGAAGTASTSGTTAGSSSAHTAGTSSDPAASGVSTSAAGVDPGVSLSATTPLASTGANSLPLIVGGLVLLVVGWLGRRRLLGRRNVPGSP
jgi:ABC-type phosphate transport system substrate-binding protein